MKKTEKYLHSIEEMLEMLEREEIRISPILVDR